MATLDELQSWFQESYQEQVEAVLDQELKVQYRAHTYTKCLSRDFLL